MAEEIVACPGCAKKFRIPEGAPPGSFPCTACSVDVPYGAPAARGGARPAAKQPAKAAAPAARAAAPATAARTATSQRVSTARAEAPRGRRAARDDEEPPKKSYQGLIWGGIVLGGGALIGIVYAMTKPDAPPAPAAAPAVAAKPAEQPKPPTPPPAKKPAEQPKSATPAPTAGETPDGTKPAAPKADPKKPDEAAKPAASKGDYSSLGQKFANVAGVSDDDRATFDKYVALAMDQGSAREGAEAEGKLVKAGKKSIPSILSAFGKQSTGGKWASNDDQWAADKLQDLLHRITGGDGLNPDFYPRFMSGAPPEDFQKAATMWISWWNNKGQFKDKFKARND